MLGMLGMLTACSSQRFRRNMMRLCEIPDLPSPLLTFHSAEADSWGKVYKSQLVSEMDLFISSPASRNSPAQQTIHSHHELVLLFSELHLVPYLSHTETFRCLPQG